MSTCLYWLPINYIDYLIFFNESVYFIKFKYGIIELIFPSGEKNVFVVYWLVTFQCNYEYLQSRIDD